MESKHYSVAILLFEGADILDFAGPMEILSHVSHNKNPDAPDRVFAMTTIARTRTIRAANCLTVHADLLLEDIVPGTLDSFDMLIVPGGPPSVVNALTEPGTPELGLIAAFAGLAARQDGEAGRLRIRILFSVCTGAFLLGAAGVLAGLRVTTHHRAVDVLRRICARVHAPPAEVVHERFVDGGLVVHVGGGKDGGVKVLTAGGISSGLDASLYLVRELMGGDMAAFVARVMEYEWDA